MERNRITLSIIQKKPDPEHGATLINPNFSVGTAQEIAGKLISQNSGRSLKIIGRRIVNYLPQYFESVKTLTPEQQAQHVEALADQLRRAGAVIFQRE